MPASGPHPRSHGHRRVDRYIDAPERATHSTRIVATRVQGERYGRYRSCGTRAGTDLCHALPGLLGDDADMMSDEEVLAVARHAETLAHILIAVGLQDVRVH
jgi:hypothetical protein